MTPLPPPFTRLPLTGSHTASIEVWASDALIAYGAACAAAEREACAAQLDALGCDHCAAAIRARTMTAQPQATDSAVPSPTR
jgi:hypothetical protein